MPQIVPLLSAIGDRASPITDVGTGLAGLQSACNLSL
jgi:hypothetical protein